jgi:hypothetical protein
MAGDPNAPQLTRADGVSPDEFLEHLLSKTHVA